MSELRLAQADTGGTFEVHLGDGIVIELEENLTTGYQWELVSVDEEIAGLHSSEYSLPDHAKIGEGGRRILTFEARSVGSTEIHLKQYRPWEGDPSIIERFDVTLKVKARRARKASARRSRHT